MWSVQSVVSVDRHERLPVVVEEEEAIVTVLARLVRAAPVQTQSSPVPAASSGLTYGVLKRVSTRAECHLIPGMEKLTQSLGQRSARTTKTRCLLT